MYKLVLFIATSLQLISCGVNITNIQGTAVGSQSAAGNASTGDSPAPGIIDTIAPDDISSIALYSDYTNNTSSTISYTPDINLTHSGNDDGGSGLSHFEYQVLKDSDDSVVASWQTGGSSSSFRGSGLSLIDGETYKVEVRAVDYSGNYSNSITSNTWQVVEVSTHPYVGQGLASVSSLSDASIAASSNILNSGLRG